MTKKSWAVIGTWKFAEEGIPVSERILKEGGSAKEAVIEGIVPVEDNPEFESVGYGGLPDRDGRMTFDGGFMDGDTLSFGAVAVLEGYRSAIRTAASLAHGDSNNFLAGAGADAYAEAMGFEKRNNLTEKAKEKYEEKKKELNAENSGHDTVCFLALDEKGSICAGTSTSGMFMKMQGRVGDTPMPGNGYYADSDIGAAAATGQGEEIAKGALSYAAVSLLFQGYSAKEAAEKAVLDLNDKLVRKKGYANPMSLILVDKDGNFGIGTNTFFPFVVSDSEKGMRMYAGDYIDGKMIVESEEEYIKNHGHGIVQP